MTVRDGENVSSYLALVIRHARAAKGATQDQTGEAVHVSGSLIGMIETGRRIPHPDTARRLDEFLGTGNLIRDMSAEARQGNQPGWFRPWADQEREATSIRWHEPHIIPGLLQTEAYARAVLTSGLLTPERAEEFVAVRLERRLAVLDRDNPPPPVATFAIDADALQRGDPVILKEQLLDLVDVGDRRRIFVHVIPASAGLHIGLSGSFMLASLDGGESVGYVDDQLRGRLITDTNHVAELERAWQAVCSVMLPCDQSRELILKLVNEL